MVPFAKPYLQQSMRLGMRWLKLVEYQAGVSFAHLFRKYSLAMRCHEGKSCMLLKYLCNSLCLSEVCQISASSTATFLDRALMPTATWRRCQQVASIWDDLGLYVISEFVLL